MSKIKIETISSVHIGSGEELQEGIDYLYFSKENQIAILDEKKILSIIGEENIDQWVNIIIQEKSLGEYLETRKPGFSADDVSRRLIEPYYPGELKLSRTLKTHLTDSNFQPIIPGSSLKGAIRTAIFNHLLKSNAVENVHKKTDLKNGSRILEKEIFGNNPNSDLMRFLRVSDASFAYLTNATLMRTLNYRNHDWEFKKGVNQLVEIIGPEAEAEGTLNMATLQLEKYLQKSLDYKDRKKVNKELVSILSDEKELFRIINSHTHYILEKEEKLWDEPEFNTNKKTEAYLENLKDLKRSVENCGENECILRLGFGSGWTFITGGWPKYREDLFKEWEFLSDRLGRKGAPYFPKTRKMDVDSDILGFINISKK